MANYIFRKVDDILWQAFRARAQREGHSLRWVLLTLVQRYITKGLD